MFDPCNDAQTASPLGNPGGSAAFYPWLRRNSICRDGPGKTPSARVTLLGWSTLKSHYRERKKKNENKNREKNERVGKLRPGGCTADRWRFQPVTRVRDDIENEIILTHTQKRTAFCLCLHPVVFIFFFCFVCLMRASPKQQWTVSGNMEHVYIVIKKTRK